MVFRLAGGVAIAAGVRGSQSLEDTQHRAWKMTEGPEPWNAGGCRKVFYLLGTGTRLN